MSHQSNSILVPLFIALLLAGCGSNPPQSPAARTATAKVAPQTCRPTGYYIQGNLTCHHGIALNQNTACPRLADPTCRANWDTLDVGTSADEAKLLLGSPNKVIDSSFWSTWYYNDSLLSGNLTIKNGGVAGYTKPKNYVHLGQLIGGGISTPVSNLVAACPRLGLSDCKFNWDAIRQGATKAQIESVIGAPDSIENVSVGTGAVKFDETWVYRPSGTIRFLNGVVVAYDKPEKYTYYGPLQSDGTTPVKSL